MNKINFKKIGLFVKNNSNDILESVENLITFLTKKSHDLFIESNSASYFSSPPAQILDSVSIGNKCDLIIVIGGDGSLLKASRSIIESGTPILGINRGKLGFLADIKPAKMQETLSPILDGEYISEQRTLLQVDIMQNESIIQSSCALNDIVLYNSHYARMIDFEIFIDNEFILLQRADGLITASPTGSTAYSLSAGGPILSPALNAFTIVPMFPHTLSSRPLVIHSNSVLKLVIPSINDASPKISCDGQVHFPVVASNEIIIKKYPKPINLIHPKGYNYYALLRQKLGWNTNFTSDRTN